MTMIYQPEKEMKKHARKAASSACGWIDTVFLLVCGVISICKAIGAATITWGQILNVTLWGTVGIYLLGIPILYLVFFIAIVREQSKA